VTNTKRKLPSWLSSSEPTVADELSEKKPRASPHRDVIKSHAAEGSNGIDLMDPEQGGSSRLESQALKGKAISSTMEHSAQEGRMADSSETGEEWAIGRSSLKRRSPDVKELGGKETKKAKVEKESSTRVGPVVPAEDAFSKVPTSGSAGNELDRDQREKKLDGLLHGTRGKSVQGEFFQREMHLSKEGKGGASLEENQLFCVGSKDGPEQEFSKLMVG